MAKNLEEVSREELLSRKILEILKENGWKIESTEVKVEENTKMIKQKYKRKKGKHYALILEILRKGEELKIIVTARKREGIIKRMLGKDKTTFEIKERLGKFVDKRKRVKESKIKELVKNMLNRL